MGFKESLIYYLATTKTSSMTDIFDVVILCAHGEDPEFVKSYNWPVNSTTETRSNQTDLTCVSKEVNNYLNSPEDWKAAEFWQSYSRTVSRRGKLFDSGQYYEYRDSDDEFKDYKEEHYKEYTENH